MFCYDIYYDGRVNSYSFRVKESRDLELNEYIKNCHENYYLQPDGSYLGNYERQDIQIGDLQRLIVFRPIVKYLDANKITIFHIYDK